MDFDNVDERARSDSVDEHSDNIDERSEDSFGIDANLVDSIPVPVVSYEPVVVNNVYLSLGYENTDFTRQYKFSDVSNEALSSVSSKVQAYNANVPASDKAIFVSDDGDSMTSITAATIEVVTTEYIIKR